MIKYKELVDNFSNVIEVEDSVYRCSEETGRETYFYYIKLAPSSGARDYVLVSRNTEDDEFAQKVFDGIDEVEVGGEIIVRPMLPNSYYFSSIILAPSTYHSYLKGILDQSREDLVLCLPFHRCEFSGRELAAEFREMRRQIPDLDWARVVCPKIKLRFYNPLTKSGSGDAEVIVNYTILCSEIENLNGVGSGFVEIVNYQDQILEIVSPARDVFVLIKGRDDNVRENFEKNKVFECVRSFLVD